MNAYLQGIRQTVGETKLPGDVGASVEWCLDKLPDLYEQLDQTSEVRYADEILRLVQGMVKTLSEAKGGSAGPNLALAIIDRFRVMHEEVGLAELKLKKPAGKKKR
jgi:hypothetical protein